MKTATHLLAALFLDTILCCCLGCESDTMFENNIKVELLENGEIIRTWYTNEYTLQQYDHHIRFKDSNGQRVSIHTTKTIILTKEHAKKNP